MNMQKNDSILIEEYRRGDKNAFAELFKKYKNTVYNFIFRLVGNPDIAEDLLENTFIKMIKSLDKYKERNKFKQWLFTIANSVTMDYLRKKKREYIVDPIEEWMELSDASPSPQFLLEQKEMANLIENKISNLPPKQKQVFIMRQESDLTFKEIAEILECPISTVLSRMHNAVLNLRRFIREYEYEM